MPAFLLGDQLCQLKEISTPLPPTQLSSTETSSAMALSSNSTSLIRTIRNNWLYTYTFYYKYKSIRISGWHSTISYVKIYVNLRSKKAHLIKQEKNYQHTKKMRISNVLRY